VRAIWPFVYLAIFIGASLVGYREMSPSRLAHIDPSILSGCIFSFVLGSVGFALAVRHGANYCTRFPRPSVFRRFPLVEWRRDPLQFLLLCMLLSFGLLFGGLIRLPSCGLNGIWLVAWFACMFLGELTGLIIGCVVYRSHVRTI
jgi:hypothetical protein